MMPCVVPGEKLRLYLLNLDHPAGAPKARFFIAAGYSWQESDVLAEALRTHAADRDVEAELATPYGTKYVVRCQMPTPDGRDPCIVSVWFDSGDGRARLVSAYPH
jgi:hypothetical protein